MLLAMFERSERPARECIEGLLAALEEADVTRSPRPQHEAPPDELAGLRFAIRRVLWERRIRIGRQNRELLEACRFRAVLERWLLRAGHVRSDDDLFESPLDARANDMLAAMEQRHFERETRLALTARRSETDDDDEQERRAALIDLFLYER